MNRENIFLLAVLAVFTILLSASATYAALTFDATTVTSDSSITLTTASGSNVAVTRGLTANSATTTDSLSIGGLTTFTGATASGTAMVIGSDVVLFRNAANQLRIQGKLSLANNILSATTTDSLYVGGLDQHTAATASATALVIGADVPVYRSSANTLTLQGILALQNAETIGNSTNNVVFVNATTAALATSSATTTPGAWVSRQASTASTTVLQIGGQDVAGGPENSKSCIQMWRGNKAYKVYINGAGNGVVVAAGACNDP